MLFFRYVRKLLRKHEIEKVRKMDGHLRRMPKAALELLIFGDNIVW